MGGCKMRSKYSNRWRGAQLSSPRWTPPSHLVPLPCPAPRRAQAHWQGRGQPSSVPGRRCPGGSLRGLGNVLTERWGVLQVGAGVAVVAVRESLKWHLG